uniref:(northern house mosquito) hypothetical protein n=1 Tax=Culex pipiens TaxID=7175 RepID=A0A8D8GK39_CULPI
MRAAGHGQDGELLQVRIVVAFRVHCNKQQRRVAGPFGYLPPLPVSIQSGAFGAREGENFEGRFCSIGCKYCPVGYRSTNQVGRAEAAKAGRAEEARVAASGDGRKTAGSRTRGPETAGGNGSARRDFPVDGGDRTSGRRRRR